MALITPPPPTAKFFPKLYYHHQPTRSPSNLYSELQLVLKTRSRIITTYDHCKRHALRIVNATSESGGQGRIVLPDMGVKPLREVYRGRKWNTADKVTFGLVVALHLLCGFAPFTFNWGALWVAIGLHVVTFLGITLSFHRYLSHKSFKLPRWLEYIFAYCGTHALQGHPTYWVSMHRYHHQYRDSERDPHSPINGFWHSYVNWIFDSDIITKKCGEPNNVKDLEKQPFYRFLRRTYLVHPIALTFLLYALGGLPYIVWGMGVRTVWTYHITWMSNAICHGQGQQVWDTGDLSLNIWWLGIPTFGEAWHNNHHAFVYSARHGLEWWQIDMTWYVIHLLEIIGLATDVKLPNPTEMQRLALPPKTF